jgi:bacillolysin/neutral peptidase B
MRVAEFFENHLQILGFKSSYEYISCINRRNKDGRQVLASFLPKSNPPKAVFGTKKLSNGNSCSYAISATTVAHEFAHKLIYETIAGGNGFDYESEQSGALEESYADIFAILFANRNQPDISQWDWEIGNGFGINGRACRDVRSPQIYNDPDHMSDYIRESRDSYRCHSNNGIHNKALYYLINSKNEDKEYLFDVSSAVQLFYLSLKELSRYCYSKAKFGHSPSAMKKALDSFGHSAKINQQFQTAISESFDRVGILEMELEIEPPPISPYLKF